MDYDVVIGGAGPAGLSAALILGRACRSVLLCDSGKPRNNVTGEIHGFLSRDCEDPAQLRATARAQLARYPAVEIRDVLIEDAEIRDGGFILRLEGQPSVTGRKLLLATGITDILPAAEGFEAIYGKSAFHCPYCDGWEVRGKRFAAYGAGRMGRALALELLGWSRDIVLFTDGPADLDAGQRAELAANGIAIREEPVLAFRSTDRQLQGICLLGGDIVDRDVLFFATPAPQSCDIAEKLGCRMTERGEVDTNTYERTGVPGVYVAGDASRHVELAIVAAAEGAMAGFAINNELLHEDRVPAPHP